MRAEKKGRDPKPLNGILQCAICGNSITFFHAKKGQYTYGFCGTCKRNGISHALMDERHAADQLARIAGQAVLSPEGAEILKGGLEDFRKSERETLAARRAALKGRAQAIQEKLSKAFDALTEGSVDAKTYQERTAQWRHEKERLEIEMRQMGESRTEGKLNELQSAYKLAQEIETTVESASTKALGRIARILCTNLFVRDGTIEYSLAFPFDEIAKSGGGNEWRPLLDAFRSAVMEMAA